MRPSECLRESETWKAAASGQWTVALKAHERECPVCQEVAHVTRLMTQLAAESSESESLLASASSLWWKSQVLANWAAQERATRPIQVTWRVASIAGPLLLAVGIVSEWAQIQAWLSHFRPQWPHAWDSVGLTSGLIASLLVLGAALIGVTMVAVHRYLSFEERQQGPPPA